MNILFDFRNDGLNRKKGRRRFYTGGFAAALAATMAMPVATLAAENPTLSKINYNPEIVRLFSELDQDKSGTVTDKEYMAHPVVAQKPHREAFFRFKAMDANDDNLVTLLEFRDATHPDHPTL